MFIKEILMQGLMRNHAGERPLSEEETWEEEWEEEDDDEDW